MTIREIAKLAGVSVTTVSYVLNDTGSISEEVRQRVLKIVEDTGYRSNKMAKTLRTASSNNLGVIVEDITAWSSAKAIQGIGIYAEQHNKDILMTDLALITKSKDHFERIPEHSKVIKKEFGVLLESQVEGIIYIGLWNRDISDLLPACPVPLVLVDCFAKGSTEITYDNIEVSYSIGRHFANNGHKKIAVLCGAPHYKSCYQRLVGFNRAMSEYHIDIPVENMCMCGWHYNLAFEHTSRLLKSENMPTAIFAMNDHMAMGALRAANKLHIRIPEEVEIIGFDDDTMASYSYPMLSTVRAPLTEMGERAAQLIYEIRDGATPPESIVLPSEIVTRETSITR